MSHAVVLAQPEVHEDLRAPLAALLAREAGLQAYDAKAEIHRLPGLLLWGSPLPQAQRVAQAVRRLGLDAKTAPTSAYERFHRKTVHRGGCSKQALHLGGERGGVSRFDWEALRAVSLIRYHAIREARLAPAQDRVTRILLAPVVPLPGLRRMVEARKAMLAKKQRIAEAETYLLDLFLDPPGVALRIDARRFHYGYLQERMSERCEANFHMLVSHIAQGAPNARYSPLALRFLDGDLLDDATTTDLKQLDLMNRWLLLAREAFG